jgi:biotin synthase
MKDLIDKLEELQSLSREEFAQVLLCDDEYLFERARVKAREVYGKNIYMRGLVEFTSYCKNDCYYCGIRAGNKKAQRYRLTQEQILECCKNGYALGFRTFVLQGGEDPHFTDEILIKLIKEIKKSYPDCAVTLSIGERGYESYELLRKAGADRYLLRHETANNDHYRTLHPKEMSPDNRKNCLRNLKKLGYQTGCGFMVGSPYQTTEHIIDDLIFIKELKPHMVGIGPFIPHSDTPYKNENSGDMQRGTSGAERRGASLRSTLNIIAILRLMQPNLLIPATTALGTIDSRGRELGILAGANVVMPNISPVDARKKYMLYDNKICTGEEAAECAFCMHNRIKEIGYEIAVTRGDCHV